jgi:hypothetical protein
MENAIMENVLINLSKNVLKTTKMQRNVIKFEFVYFKYHHH